MKHTGMKWVLALGLMVPCASQAQVQSGASGTTDAIKTNFAEVTGWIVKAAEAVPEDKYGYRPAASVRTFGQLVGHIADGNNYYCRRAGGTNVEWAETVAQSGAKKAELLAKLQESIALCNTATTTQNAGRSGVLIANYGHANLHYGNIVTYMRMMGMTPPSS
jgi:uncharacterized damage-inducible protein DinB